MVTSVLGTLVGWVAVLFGFVFVFSSILSPWGLLLDALLFLIGLASVGFGIYAVWWSK